MHICYLCSEYPPERHGGVGTFTQTLGRALVRRGHSVTVVGFGHLLTTAISEHEDEGVNVIRVRSNRVPRLGALMSSMRLQRVLHGLNDVRHIDVLEGPELSLALLSREVLPAKVIRMHGGHHFFCHDLGQQRKPVRSWLEHRSFRNADYLCAVSRHVANVTSELLNLRTRRIDILPNPVDTIRFAPRSDIAEVPFRIVFVGTICEKKGVRQLIQAMPAILEHEPHAHLQLAGRDWRDPSTGTSYTDEMRKVATRLAPGRVSFLGTVNNHDLPSLLASASVCVMPSHAEAMSITWLEALSVGRPLVASRIGPGPEVVEEGVSGLLCDPHDPQSIASCVISLLSDAVLRDRLGQAGRRRAVNHFSREALAKQNEEFYARCVEQTEGARN
jgi:glycosyltransferase involved in cell wall biosynthesis